MYRKMNNIFMMDFMNSTNPNTGTVTFRSSYRTVKSTVNLRLCKGTQYLNHVINYTTNLSNVTK